MKQILVVLLFAIGFWTCNAQDMDKMKSKEVQTKKESKEMTVAVIKTNMGTIEVELNRDKSPITVDNFLKYANSGFYDGLLFHRVISNFMIQGGGITPDGNQKATNPPITLESNNGLTNDVGTIAMARTNDPNSATSQFFINVADNSFLNYASGNPGYAVFGKVISGMDVVYAISKVATNKADNKPLKDVVIESINIEKRETK